MRPPCTSGWRTDQCRRGCGPLRYHCVGLALALIETEWRVLVVHQGDVGENPVAPAVDADEQAEGAAGILPGDQQEEAGHDDQQVEDRVAADGLETGGPVGFGPPVREDVGDDEADDEQVRDGEQPPRTRPRERCSG
jgi:hypothetical protein